MTQMMLFDSATHPAETATATLVRPGVTPESRNPESRNPESRNPEPRNIAAAIEHESGLNHMGDLARLVLLRYELVAKRRADMAARNAK